MANKFSLAKLAGVILISAVGRAYGQQELAGAKITQKGNQDVVSVDNSRPLYFALCALSERYGWSIDYEDPIYGPAESRDETDPDWRRMHPGAVGFLAPAGGKLKATFSRSSRESLNRTGVLGDLIRQYNQSENPGLFHVVRTDPQRLAVIGVSRRGDDESSGSPLNRQFKTTSGKRSFMDALQEITTQCGSSEYPIALGTLPASFLSRLTVDGSTQELSCREQLSVMLSAVPTPLSYALLYDIGSHTFVLNIVADRLAVVGTDGKQTSVPRSTAVPQ